MPTSPTSAPSERTQIRRVSSNADYDQSTLYAIIDEAYICHVAFSDEHGTHCIPTTCWREGDHLYIHGSNAGRMSKILSKGTQVCITITHLDGLVLARAAFNHSMNYRSAMIYGVFERVNGEQEKALLMDAFLSKVFPGRRSHVRPASIAEIAGTTVMGISLNEAACKVRTGGPKDDEADMKLPVWAGVLPFSIQHLTPIADEKNMGEAPSYVSNWTNAR